MTELRVGLVSVSFTMFDEQMPAGFRDWQETVGRSYAELLGEHFTVTYPGLICDEEHATRVSRLLRDADVHAVVLAPAMAAPPSYAVNALEGVDAPVVIWNAPQVRRLGDDLDHVAATRHTTQVGSVMSANALLREGRAVEAVTASPHDSAAVDRLVRIVRASAVARTIRGATCMRIGDPVPGYLDVEATEEDLAQLGVRERRVLHAELVDVFESVTSEEIEAASEGMRRRGWNLAAAADSAHSTRLAVALSHLAERHGVACGTVNCHGECFRQSEAIGITACLGVSLLTESGVPMSCTGDQPTALALRIAQQLSGRALYSEFYTPELETGLMLLAAGGEGDPSWASSAEDIRVVPNDYYPGARGNGASLSFALDAGPATVLSLSPVDGTWRLTWATGEIVESRYPDLGGPNGMFRFDSGPSTEAGTRWLASGATHHNALASGRLDVEIPTLCAALRIDSVRV